jgi:hypothetical protein
MFAQRGLFSSVGRTAVMATVAALALTAVEPTLALAGPAPKGVSAATGSSGATDFSARRRYYRGGGGAAAAAFAGIVGTGIAIAASQNRRGYYRDSYGYYDGGPSYGYYDGGPAPYVGAPRYSGNPYAPTYNGNRPYVNGEYGPMIPQ